MAHVSRSQDRSAAFTIVQIEWLLEQCRAAGHLEGISRLQLVSDTGTHFRSYTVLATCACNLLQALRPTIAEIAWHFGPEAHFKNRVDGLFAELREALRQASLEGNFLEDKELVEAYQAWWASRSAQDPLKIPATFTLFEPAAAKSGVPLSCFKPATLPAQIRGCHRWAFRVNDTRYRSLVNPSGILTAVDVNCQGFRDFGLVRTGHTTQAANVRPLLLRFRMCVSCLLRLVRLALLVRHVRQAYLFEMPTLPSATRRP